MTVPVQDPEVAYNGNGVTTSFAFGFKVLDADDLIVEVGGVLKALNVDYTVTGVGLDGGGNVIFAVAPPAGSANVTLQREVTVNRLTDYQYSGDFQSPTVNRDFDRTVMMAQDSKRVINRALVLPVGDTADTSIPSVAQRALRGLAFDAAGNLIAATASDATSLSAILISAATAAVGAGVVGYDGAKSYVAATVGAGIKAAQTDATTGLAFKADVADATNAAKGAALMAYKPTWTGAVGRTLASKLAETISACDFGLSIANTGTANNNAMAQAIAYIVTQGGGTIFIPRGSYNFATTIDITAVNNLRITGEGPDATVLFINSATANFIYAAGAGSGHTYYQTLDNFSLNSTVTRTAGAMIKLGTGASELWKRGMIHRVRIQQHFDGIDIPGFEQSTLSEVFIVNPTGAGTALICGKQAASNQGANLNVINCFMRGNNDLTNNTPVGSKSLVVYDVEALFFVNTDMANFADQIMVVNPQTRTANCHFVQTYFDGTLNADNVAMTGTGIKQQFQFTGCWFNGAGRFGAGHIDAYGVNAVGSGEYYDINFTGCRWLSHAGSQFVSTSLYLDFNFSGCVFVNPGLNASSVQRHSVLLSPTGTVVKWPNFSGCKFQGTPAGSFNIACTGNASQGLVVSACTLDRGLSKVSTNYFGNVAGNYDPVAFASIASASAIAVPATFNYVVISGTTTINRIDPTYAGHIISLRFTGALTVVDDNNNLRLVGNYVTTGNSILTLVCEANGDWREVARATS